MESALIVGLGNPGAAYGQTRHNVGFMVIDELCTRLRVRTERSGDEYREATALFEGTVLHLVKPATFMNGSGAAVVQALGTTGVPAAGLIIILDDFQLPLGMLRLRPGGSDGGHHGLASVITALGTPMVPRLRCGIGAPAMPPPDKRRNFVLGPFGPEEAPAAHTMVLRAADAACVFAVSGIDRAMNIYNTQ